MSLVEVDGFFCYENVLGLVFEGMLGVTTEKIFLVRLKYENQNIEHDTDHFKVVQE